MNFRRYNPFPPTVWGLIVVAFSAGYFLHGILLGIWKLNK